LYGPLIDAFEYKKPASHNCLSVERVYIRRERYNFLRLNHTLYSVVHQIILVFLNKKLIKMF